MRNLPNMSDARRLFHNRVWILRRAAESMVTGRPIIDLGADEAGRVGKFYKAESDILDFLR